MTTKLLAAALSVLAAAAVPASASSWKATGCKDECMAAHDSKIVGCKTIKSKEGPACTRKADAERTACEAKCDAKYPEAAAVKSSTAPATAPAPAPAPGAPPQGPASAPPQR